jgi:hypothetical protein
MRDIYHNRPKKQFVILILLRITIFYIREIFNGIENFAGINPVEPL